MEKVSKKNEDTTVKLSKKVLNQLSNKARPFESKKKCLERIITQTCGTPKETIEQHNSPESKEQESPEAES